MDKKKEFKTLCPPTSVQGHIQQILKQNNSLSGQLSEELETIVATLVALPFKDELQRGIFLEQVQKLQGYHIIQIFNLAVAPCRNSVVESSIHFGQNFKKLVDICILFCYTYDVSKRVAFYYYTSALQFCFPSDTNLKCLSLGVLSNLLKLVQIFQDGKLKASADSYYDDNFILLGKHNYTKDFFSRLLQVLDSRRNEDYLVEVIDITVRLASVDDKDVIKSNDYVGALREGQTVSSFLVTNWMKLLELANVSNAFACALAAVDVSGEKIEPLGVGFQYSASTFPCQSTIFYFLGVLEEMKRKADNLRMPNDKTRMDILLNHVDHFCIHPNVAALSLQLLAAITISNDVLREVLDGFFHKERTES